MKPSEPHSVVHLELHTTDLPCASAFYSRLGPAGWRSVVATPKGGEIAFWQPKLGAGAMR